MNMKIIFASLLAAFGLFACSSMSVEPTEESLPSDFDVNTYFAINKDVGYATLRYNILKINTPVYDSVLIPDTSISKPIRRKIQATRDSFMANTELLRYVFNTFSGYRASDWSDTLDVDQKRMCMLFSVLNMTMAENRAYLEAYKVDMHEVETQYIVYGKIEGRPYKYCQPGHSLIEKSTIILDSAHINAKGFPDYRPRTFCLDTTDYMVYQNQ